MNPITTLPAVPKTCDLCHLDVGSTYVDGATIFGPWANMCSKCFPSHGVGLGMGRGQQYFRRNDDGRWAKIAG